MSLLWNIHNSAYCSHLTLTTYNEKTYFELIKILHYTAIWAGCVYEDRSLPWERVDAVRERLIAENLLVLKPTNQSRHGYNGVDVYLSDFFIGFYGQRLQRLNGELSNHYMFIINNAYATHFIPLLVAILPKSRTRFIKCTRLKIQTSIPNYEQAVRLEDVDQNYVNLLKKQQAFELFTKKKRKLELQRVTAVDPSPYNEGNKPLGIYLIIGSPSSVKHLRIYTNPYPAERSQLIPTKKSSKEMDKKDSPAFCWSKEPVCCYSTTYVELDLKDPASNEQFHDLVIKIKDKIKTSKLDVYPNWGLDQTLVLLEIIHQVFSPILQDNLLFVVDDVVLEDIRSILVIENIRSSFWSITDPMDSET